MGLVLADLIGVDCARTLDTLIFHGRFRCRESGAWQLRCGRLW
jgi:hypothetical protein